MNQVLLLHSSFFIFHVMGTPQLRAHHGRRVCGSSFHSNGIVMTTQSYVRAAHKPYIALCHGHRLCSAYKTSYYVAHRPVSSRVALRSHFYPECCPGWERFHSHNCNRAACTHSCVNGGTCHRPNQCVCVPGWRGNQCQTDVNECSEERPCAHKCVNTAGSYRCECRDGFRLMGDGRSCQSLPPPPPPPPPPPSTPPPVAGGHSHADENLNLVENVTEEVQSLRNRVELLEKTLQMALTPYNSIFPLSAEEDLSEKTTLLSYSFQQLDRIDSLSEQIGFLEERLGTCSCQGDQQTSPIK